MTTMRKKGKFTILIDPDKCTGCLRCQLTCSFQFHRVFNPALARIKVLMTNDRGLSYQIYHTDECIKCGRCARACVFGALQITEGGE